LGTIGSVGEDVRVTDAADSFTTALRDALSAADYTYDGVAELLGPDGAPGAVTQRDGARPAAYPWRQPARDADPALPAPVDGLGRRRREGAARSGRPALCRGRPRAQRERGRRAARRPALRRRRPRLWVVSDLTPGLDGTPNKVGADHVLGISSASTSLAQLTLRHDVGSALDLGTGCGVQALHLATHADRVVATDVNQRALWIAELNARSTRPPMSRSATAPSSSRSAARRLRPDRHQPAVRDLAGDGGAPGLPRLRPARRPRRRGHRPRRARRSSTTVAGARSSPTG
jgi:hypothetical protein